MIEATKKTRFQQQMDSKELWIKEILLRDYNDLFI